jgi:plastocyanin
MAALGVVIGLTAVLALAGIASAQMAARTWRVWVGWAATATGQPPRAPSEVVLSANAFYPGPIEINVGDTIDFQFTGFHTVALGRDRMFAFTAPDFAPNPEVAMPSGGNTFDGTNVIQSGFVDPGQVFKVTFSAPGEFKALCDIHPQHETMVRVKPVGQAVAMSPEQAGQAGLMQAMSDVANQAVPLILNEARVRTGEGPAGALREISAGFGNGRIEGFRFLPQEIVVRQGEWVRWINPDPEAPHTVTLLPGGGMPDLSAPPPEDFNPFTNTPTTVYDGSNLVNIIVVLDPMLQEVTGASDRGEIQFTAPPGEYVYFCVPHLEVGMVGKVTVLPQ